MALKMDFTDWGKTWTDGYWYILGFQNVDRTKRELTMVVQCFPDSTKTGRPLIELAYRFVGENQPSPMPQYPLFDDWFSAEQISPEGRNVLERGYVYLLTLPEYSTAVPA
jgi:hypothetical protein